MKDHFKMFGEIESIALAKNLHSTKRNDFAFINYKTCEAALSCIEALTCKKSTNHYGPKVCFSYVIKLISVRGSSLDPLMYEWVDLGYVLSTTGQTCNIKYQFKRKWVNLVKQAESCLQCIFYFLSYPFKSVHLKLQL